ncbi:Signal transducer regulating beta-lactamase production, contains metallopeptidase domain [Parapedobacter luteus]|uniref:Signal transducer regulating beta-lactamase production, contains metallopeptidase domain n=1 Tax=Parapedobacter luteus TaxID=623280 RepID=A0A1T5EA36_9SPHI|nr:M56 family metallopeptidase [Parapedobacter luteus]SKB80726.1 Signal transducer regulating beta-lactamase production, contains metallopeptidase domain [Parapedobacter luteus]
MENFAPLIFNGLGWAIFHSLWMGAVLYGLLMLVFQLSNWRAKTKASLLAAALSVLLTFFCLTFFYDLINRILSSQPITVTGSDIALLQLIDYDSTVSIQSHMERYFPVVAAFYILGVFLQSVLVVNGFRKLHVIRKAGLLEVPDSWKTLFASTKQQLGLHRPIAFHLSTLVDVPMVIGHLKPIILFPMALYTGMRMDQVEAVLIHELAHIKRSDYFMNLVKTLTETLLFFNPFVWLIGRMLEVERENACDDVVVGLMGRPVQYARTLLWLEEQRQLPSHSLAMQAIDKKKQLLHRIQRITNMEKNYLNAKHKLAILTLMLGCIASLAWVKPLVRDAAPIDTSLLSSVTIDTQVGVATDSLAMASHVAAGDTLPNREKQHVVMTDGEVFAYESYDELPDSLKIKVEAMRRQTDSIKTYFNSPEWKARIEGFKLSDEQVRTMTAQARIQADSLKAYFDSPEWKAKVEKMKLSDEQLHNMTATVQKQADSLKAYFNSPAWKTEIEALKLSDDQLRNMTAQVRKQTDSIRAYFNSTEWKAKMEALKLSDEQLRDMTAQMRSQADSLRAYFDSSEWKNKMKSHMDSVKRYFGSPEWKGKMEHEPVRNKTVLAWPLAIQQHYAAVSEEQMQRYLKALKQFQEPYIDGSVKPWVRLDSR